MRKLIAVLTIVVLATALVACSSGGGAAPKQTPDLSGQWQQANPDGDAYQAAIIEGDTITIWWVNNANETQSLYWVGSFAKPDEPSQAWKWTSTADREKMSGSMLASQDDTKEFEYSDGQITYRYAIMGTTKTVHMKRVK